ncbi:hypothetical protein BG004_002609, partial [Podila humilis]
LKIRIDPTDYKLSILRTLSRLRSLQTLLLSVHYYKVPDREKIAHTGNEFLEVLDRCRHIPTLILSGTLFPFVEAAAVVLKNGNDWWKQPWSRRRRQLDKDHGSTHPKQQPKWFSSSDGGVRRLEMMTVILHEQHLFSMLERCPRLEVLVIRTTAIELSKSRDNDEETAAAAVWRRVGRICPKLSVLSVQQNQNSRTFLPSNELMKEWIPGLEKYHWQQSTNVDSMLDWMVYQGGF